METGVSSAPSYEPTVRPRRLERLNVGELDHGSAEACLRLLRDAGLCAECSKIHPGGIVGGRRVVDLSPGAAFEDAFLIRPVDAKFGLAVPGLGFFDEELTVSLRAATERVIEVYRDSGFGIAW